MINYNGKVTMMRNQIDKESLREKFKLGLPRKSEPLSLTAKAALKEQADRYSNALKMGESYKKNETRRFGGVEKL